MTKFSPKTIPFLTKAAKQKSAEWLDRHQKEYETLVKTPFVDLAKQLQAELQPLARNYHFPTKGIGRIKKPAHKVGKGESPYKGWLSLSASRPSGSRFERTPHLFFGILPNEPDWKGIIVSGGLFLPSSPQMKKIRQAIADDAGPFHELFKDRDFKARFKDGFSDWQTAVRDPRGFDADHPDMAWIKLKSFMVVKKIPPAQFTSARFADNVIKDFTQALRLNDLLQRALTADRI